MLRKKAARTRQVNLSLGPAAAGDGPIPAVPMSPTDQNLSPCSKTLLTDNRKSHPDTRSTFKSRQWDSIDDDLDSFESSESEEEESDGAFDGAESDASTDGLLEEGRSSRQGSGSGSQQLDANWVKAMQRISEGKVVEPRICPTNLPITISSGPLGALIMDNLGWNHSDEGKGKDMLLTGEEEEGEEYVAAGAVCRGDGSRESSGKDGDVHSYCRGLTEAKLAKLIAAAPREVPGLLIACEQVVEFKDAVRRKPRSPKQAREYLMSYGGHAAFLVTAVAVCNTETQEVACAVDVARVVFARMTDAIVDRIVDRGLVMTAAGGLALQDPDLQHCVVLADGDLDSILGLPVDTLCPLIAKVDPKS